MRVLLFLIHGTILRLFWRLIAPRHPRGWLDIHAVYEDEENPTTLWIHCHGMERWQLPNIEFVGVPAELRGYAHGIMMDLVGYMKNIKPMKADENFGGMFVDENQPAWHVGTMRTAPAREDSNTELRVVDYGEPADAGFPVQLFVAHLCALASVNRNPVKQEELARKATELFPGDPRVVPECEFEQGVNPSNFIAWEVLGNALCDQGRDDEGIACLEESVARWTVAAESMAEFIREEIAEGKLPSPEKDPRAIFWQALDVEAVRQKVIDRVEVGGAGQ